MVTIWRYTKFDVTYSFMKGGGIIDDKIEVKKIKIRRLSPFASDSVESSIFCGITDESRADAQDVLGKSLSNVVGNLSFIGELILFLVMAGILGLIAYFLFSTLANKFMEVEMLYYSIVSTILGLLYSFYISKYVDRLLFVVIPMKRGWIPLDHLRDEIEKLSNQSSVGQ